MNEAIGALDVVGDNSCWQTRRDGERERALWDDSLLFLAQSTTLCFLFHVRFFYSIADWKARHSRRRWPHERDWFRVLMWLHVLNFFFLFYFFLKLTFYLLLFNFLLGNIWLIINLFRFNFDVIIFCIHFIFLWKSIEICIWNFFSFFFT